MSNRPVNSKINTLKAAILAALPELKRDPDRVRMWIERGSASSTQTDDRAITSAFQLNVLVVEMASDMHVLFLAVFEWMRVNQPDLMVPGKEGISFDADILDNSTADILLQIQLDQAVGALCGAKGGYDLQYMPERDPPDPDILSIIAPEAAPPLKDFEVTEDLPPWEV